MGTAHNQALGLGVGQCPQSWASTRTVKNLGYQEGDSCHIRVRRHGVRDACRRIASLLRDRFLQERCACSVGPWRMGRGGHVTDIMGNTCNAPPDECHSCTLTIVTRPHQRIQSQRSDSRLRNAPVQVAPVVCLYCVTQQRRRVKSSWSH